VSRQSKDCAQIAKIAQIVRPLCGASADHLKLMFPMSWAIANMAWAMEDGKSMLKNARFQGRSNWDWGKQSLQHGLSFLLKCHIRSNEFVVQVCPPCHAWCA
jgi:hypothetical protein